MKKILISAMMMLMLIISGCDSGDAATSTSTENFPQFTSVDLNGNTATEKIFADKKITVVNIWGTFCPPCIAEMPELGEWARNMPNDAQLIGIVCDVQGNNDEERISLAKKILAESNANFTNLLPSGGIMKYLETVDAVPTTIFVDAQGNIVGEKIIGAEVDRYKKMLESLLK